ncbi:hypothetical protein [Proteus columbae]|uniref:hypothetical protein n=1 Tax=Proteus columbae TaxID=1987580 RepID=UPI00288AB113|nr:hypothetical protein [Proteus columbae]
MKINNITQQVSSIEKCDINIKEKYQIKNSIKNILNTFSSFYVERKNNTFLFKLSFFIKELFNLKVCVTFLLDKSQNAKLNNLSTLLPKGDRIEFNNCKLINSNFVSFKCEQLDSFFLSLNVAIKNGCHDNAKILIRNYLYEKSQTKGDFITIMSISIDVINNYQKEELSRHNSECTSILDYINFNYKQHIDMALNYACEEIDGKGTNKLGNSIRHLVNTMHDIYSMEMEKRFIINIAKCFMSKIAKYNVENYNNEIFINSIMELLINKLKNNESVKEFVDNMLYSEVLEDEDIINAKEKTVNDEIFISEYNRKIKKHFSKNINNDEVKDNIANVIRDNYEIILNQMKNKPNYLENERVLLDIIDYLKSENDWSLNLL